MEDFSEALSDNFDAEGSLVSEAAEAAFSSDIDRMLAISSSSSSSSEEEEEALEKFSSIMEEERSSSRSSSVTSGSRERMVKFVRIFAMMFLAVVDCFD